MINRDRLLERFLRYVIIPTTSDPDADCYPSSSGQWELGKVLVEELVEMGLADSCQDEHGLIWATLPSNVSAETPTIAWNAHLDTSPETSGEGAQKNTHHRLLHAHWCDVQCGVCGLPCAVCV